MTDAPSNQLPPIAAAVIVHEGKVLLVKRRVSEGSLSWQFPAGAIEPGETPSQAAVREAKEETGLTVAESRLLGERIHPSTGRAMIYVACDLIEGQATVGDDDELSDFTWSDRDSLNRYVPHGLHPVVQKHLDAALAEDLLERFCRQVRARTKEHQEAMRTADLGGWPSILVGILRQELDSMVRVMYLLAIADRELRSTMIAAAVSGKPWGVPSPKGKTKKVTDREMVDAAQNMHGWAQSVYRFGCSFIHLSNLHDHQARDPFRGLPFDERRAIADYLRHYHGGNVSPESTFDEVRAYLPEVLKKISSNLETYIRDLESDRDLA